MTTTFVLTPGYAWETATDADEILTVCRTVALDTGKFRAKCVEYGADMVDETGSGLDSYIKRYEELPSEDLTLRKHEEGVISYASGGGISRMMKERVRRAFMILVLDECYKRGLAVSLAIV